MKGFFGFLRKVIKENSEYYHKEYELVQESVLYIVMGIFSLLLLVTPWGRWLVKWIAYISMGFMVIAAIALICGNHRVLKSSYKYDKKLEKLGTTREQEEKNREELCEMEGDDALQPHKKFVYFADASALAHYADALYGCFLAQTFKPKYMQLPDDAEVYTTQLELNKLRKLEFEKTAENAPYEGYSSFIRANIHVLPAAKQTSEEELINSLLLFQLDLDPSISVAIISTNDELAKMASEYTFEIINPLFEATDKAEEVTS